MAKFTNGANTLIEYLELEIAWWCNPTNVSTLGATSKANAAGNIKQLTKALNNAKTW